MRKTRTFSNGAVHTLRECCAPYYIELSKYEDIMEKYGIDTVEQLDEILKVYKFLGDHDYSTLPREDFDLLFKNVDALSELKRLIQFETIFWRHVVAGKRNHVHYYCLGKRISKKKYEWFKEVWK